MKNINKHSNIDKSLENNIVNQMVDGILGKKADSDLLLSNEIKQNEEARHNLEGRAMEYLMFLDDDE